MRQRVVVSDPAMQRELKIDYAYCIMKHFAIVLTLALALTAPAFADIYPTRSPSLHRCLHLSSTITRPSALRHLVLTSRSFGA